MPGEETDIVPDDGNEAAASSPEVDQPQSAPQDPLAMLKMLRSSTQDPVKAMLGALGGNAQDNPQLAMVMELLETQQDDDSEERLREELRAEVQAEQAEAVAELADTARQTFAELEACRSRIESLAAALGACPDCFGSNLLCETCGGEGSPGSRLPQAAEFERYVRPAVARVRTALRGVTPPRPWPQGDARRTAAPPPKPTGAVT